MLKSLRKKTKIVIWTVVFAFILWGAFTVSTQWNQQDRLAGEVFGREVPFQEFNRFYRAAQIFSPSGRKYEDEEVVKQQAWQDLIYSREAKRQKIDVADDEVRNEILRLLKDQKLENPAPDVYERWVRQTLGESPQEFEGQVRELLRIQKMMRQLREAAVDPPREEEAREKFVFEQNKISAEFISFEKEDEAKDFSSKNPSERLWGKYAEGRPGQVTKTGMIPLRDLARVWLVPPDDALRLHKLEKGTLSEPVKLGNQKFGVFFIGDKEIADEAKYETEFKMRHLEELTEMKRYRRFVEWNTDLQARAKLKDFLPQSQPANPSNNPNPS